MPNRSRIIERLGGVGLDEADRDMGRRRGQAVPIQEPADFARRVVVVAGELDLLVADFRELLERTGEVRRRLPSQRVKLDADCPDLTTPSLAGGGGRVRRVTTCRAD